MRCEPVTGTIKIKVLAKVPSDSPPCGTDLSSTCLRCMVLLRLSTPWTCKICFAHSMPTVVSWYLVSSRNSTQASKVTQPCRCPQRRGGQSMIFATQMPQLLIGLLCHGGSSRHSRQSYARLVGLELQFASESVKGRGPKSG